MNPLRIGTDCSGIEAPVMALQLLKIPHRHVFSTEIDPHARQSIRANYSPEIEYTDLFDRNVNTLPDMDIYVCGFPCQSFSTVNAAGQAGFAQKHNKGIVFFKCYDVICIKQPVIFILENVKNIVSHDKGHTFKVIQSYLDSLDDLYLIQHKVLNAKEYDGGLQNRQRLYIVGVRRDHLVTNHDPATGLFPPQPPLPNVPISSVFLDDGDAYPDTTLTQHKIQLLQELQAKGFNLDDDLIVNLNVSGGSSGFQVHAMPDCCPCLLANSTFYITSKQRNMRAREALRIQGFPDTFKQVVSERQMLKQVGNSMCIPILKALFIHLFSDAFMCSFVS
jgi:DNA (cytosine-5)-methyltransferase 1